MSRVLAIVVMFSAVCSPGMVRADGVEKWFFAYVDLLNDPVCASDKTNYSASELIKLLKPLKEQNYSVIVLSSFQLGVESLMNPDAGNSENARKVQENLKRLAAEVEMLGMQMIPEVMPVGPSESILSEHRCLAEGTPVREMTFNVKRTASGQLQAMPVSKNRLPFEDFAGPWAEVAEKWNLGSNTTGLSQSPFAPTGSKSSLEIQFGPAGVNAGVELSVTELSLKPWHQYRLSFSVKTVDLEPLDKEAGFTFYSAVSGKPMTGKLVPLERANQKIGATQDWTNYSVILNSYEFCQGEFWFGFDGLSSGQAYLTNFRLQEIGGANLIQRDDDPNTTDLDEGLPICVKIKGTNQTLVEGQDFEPWRDTLVEGLGWFQHEHSGTPLRIKNASLEGKELSVDYYHAALPVDERGYVCCSLRHPKVLGLFRQQVAQIHRILSPKRWLINHDEIRAMGHDPLSKCDSPAKILSENLRTCRDIIKSTSADAGVIVFSDMYDPNHNAIRFDKLDDTGKMRLSYYPMVNGGFFESWVGMNSDITILNWQTASFSMNKPNLDSWKASLCHFKCDVKVRQVISGFYDVDVNAAVEPNSESEAKVRARTLSIFETAVQSGVRPHAVCYYSTKRNHGFTDVFSKVADEVFRDRNVPSK